MITLENKIKEAIKNYYCDSISEKELNDISDDLIYEFDIENNLEKINLFLSYGACW
ncbi:MAG: hypothetical protein ACRCX2_28795 [Paraclostridium sp.]